ncbi:MAG TPA: ABC transporter ATP-binding protein [Bacteroidales bacterium]|jgi:lipoprotein-releasing system ATP-binding protein|nr:ABC transporter ATP-binding protein [Bacteroidales bacterium]OQC47026.1 MAG: Lipoprotein-releasing system ATP-binding protein LolD [Bacteroidetes bacterium ADurb.Bin035]MBP8946938.1 ABC transporter ATP-binding protein [Bacteroidales bacterium]HCM29745.1 lipoprotein-releasing system ATP-binding protein LolD [Bacteroidales bacterium]HNQ19601.1 ABC transporter ATP-binding protein [Bacteroidales bacterium]
MKIKLENVYKTFKPVEVLKDINLEILDNEFISIVGPSGAGKSTLLHLIGTLEKPDKGTVKYDDKDIYKLNDKELSNFRNKNIGFVFQFHHLLPEFSAIENVMLPALIAGISKEKATVKAERLLTELNLKHRLTHKPQELSGGEQQRVAIARALINDPKFLLADEPTGNLDSQNAEEVINLFKRLHNQANLTIILVTHQESFANISDRIIHIKDGYIVK